MFYCDWKSEKICAYCGEYADTVDHVPSKCFLDSPLPNDLPTVPCCQKCNKSFSEDEEYVSCLIDCTKAGTTNPAKIGRIKTKKTLLHSYKLQQRLENQLLKFCGVVLWDYERKRLDKVIWKLAFGHLAYENQSLLYSSKYIITLCKALNYMSEKEHQEFETPYQYNKMPQIGCIASYRHIIIEDSKCFAPWIVVQPNRYRYCTSSDGKMVKFVIAEYLAAEVCID